VTFIGLAGYFSKPTIRWIFAESFQETEGGAA